MCGICAVIQLEKDVVVNYLNEELMNKLRHRGPDHFQKTTATYKKITSCFYSSILHLRGSSIEKQPFKNEKGDILMWNGQIFNNDFAPSENMSDTRVLGEMLFKCVSVTDVLDVIKCIRGPYAFVFYQSNGLLWFGRDIFGRRSLLWNAEKCILHLSSVAYGKANWSEVPTEGIFCLDLNASCVNDSFIIYKYPWTSAVSGLPLKTIPLEEMFLDIKFEIKLDICLNDPISVQLNREVPDGDVNLDLKMLEGNCHAKPETLCKLLNKTVMIEIVQRFEEVLSEAVRKRVTNQQHLCKSCYTLLNSKETKVICDHASTGILFSGGLDSIVIACLADRHLDQNQPIDLINVAFAAAPTLKNSKTVFNTPDRITGRNGVISLGNVCPARKWNFVEVNVTKDELILKRKETVSELLKPSNTVLDDSIGCALWFAAHGEGVISSTEGCHNYKSPARVLLVGMGADEQLAGYSRHRGKFSVAGWNGLIEEISVEIDRIGSRNLGRDDRIIADNGVESRYPFLDENVVSFLNGLPIWFKANLNYPRGIGEKLLLRLLAFKLGLTEAAVLPKRAIQFGSRIARIENNKEKGSDICDRLSNLGT
ncbi:Asparagine synthetase domain-containing protein 1, partial [Stegodyphus mimosarum]